MPWLLDGQDERKAGNFHYIHLSLCEAACELAKLGTRLFLTPELKSINSVLEYL